MTECSVEAEIQLHGDAQAQRYERIQAKSRAYHKWRETAEMALSG
jgi:hypothetical protein